MTWQDRGYWSEWYDDPPPSFYERRREESRRFSRRVLYVCAVGILLIIAWSAIW